MNFKISRFTAEIGFFNNLLIASGADTLTTKAVAQCQVTLKFPRDEIASGGLKVVPLPPLKSFMVMFR
jgi:hypothetical protein